MRSSTPFSGSEGLTLGTSRSGHPFASHCGLRLNSAYDPIREAARFVDQQRLPTPPVACLILGDTLPYLREALADRYPQSKVISIYYHDDLAGPEAHRRTGPFSSHLWSPSDSRDLRSFLHEELSELDLARLVVLEWPPSTKAFPELATRVRTTVGQYVREAVGNQITTAAFGRIWIHNLFANYLGTGSWYALSPHHRPVVIAASGPSLTHSIPVIASHRKQLSLVALPSALEALFAARLYPDLIVSVDAGYWARTHLRSVQMNGPRPIAFPLIASHGIWRRTSIPVIFSSGSFVESELFRMAGLAPVEVPSTGTVAAAAHELGAAWTDGPLIFAGLDLCYDDIQEHARPHAFDAYFELQTGRTRPLPSVIVDRFFQHGARRSPAGRLESPAMKTYAGWFRELAAGDRNYRLMPSSVDLPGFRGLDSHAFSRLIEDIPLSGQPSAPRRIYAAKRAQRLGVIASLLRSWEDLLGSSSPQGIVSDLRSSRHASAPLHGLFSSLDPRGFARLGRALRDARSPVQEAKELIETARREIAFLENRYCRERAS